MRGSCDFSFCNASRSLCFRRMCRTKTGYNSKKQYKRLVFVTPSPHDVFQRNCCDSHHYFITNLFNAESTRTLQPCSPTLMCCNIHAGSSNIHESHCGSSNRKLTTRFHFENFQVLLADDTSTFFFKLRAAAWHDIIISGELLALVC